MIYSVIVNGECKGRTRDMSLALDYAKAWLQQENAQVQIVHGYIAFEVEKEREAITSFRIHCEGCE